MKSSYQIEDLDKYQNDFKDFGISDKMAKVNNKYYIMLNTSSNSLIPFKGLLRYSNDTIYYRGQNENAVEQVLFNFSAKLFSSWTIEYENHASDSICYMGEIYKNNSLDTFELFMFTPIKYLDPDKSSYINYVSLTRKGIQSITFYSPENMWTVEFVEDKLRLDFVGRF